MKRVAVATLLVLGSCNFAVKHPATTAGIVAGTLALGTCELASSEHEKCFIASGAVGLGLALIAGVALWLGSEDEPAPATSETPPPRVDWDKVPDTTPKEPTKAPPAPSPAPSAAPSALPDPLPSPSPVPSMVPVAP